MKNNHTKSNKRLVYTSCFNFTYLGRVSVTILPFGLSDFKLVIKGARMFYDDNDYKNDLVFLNKKYKTEYKIPYLSTAILAFNRTVYAIIETFKNENFDEDMNYIDNHLNDFLDEIKRLL